MAIENLLKSISKLLNKLEIPYMLTGSVAMNFYAISRATRDIDIVVNRKETDIENFIAGCANFYFNKNSIVEEIRRKGMFYIIDTISGYKPENEIKAALFHEFYAGEFPDEVMEEICASLKNSYF
jgi:hypothetical protein